MKSWKKKKKKKRGYQMGETLQNKRLHNWWRIIFISINCSVLSISHLSHVQLLQRFMTTGLWSRIPLWTLLNQIFGIGHTWNLEKVIFRTGNPHAQGGRTRVASGE
jgi:hypothetical protein